MFELRAKSKTEVDVLMYGSISEWGKVRAEDFINKLSDAKSNRYEKVNLKINCPGGSIFEGLAIMSQMNTQEIHITGIVEGMACSMGAIILQSCHKRVMVKGTRLMVHQGTGGVYGQVSGIRNYADLLESLNKTLAEILSKRSNRKDVKWIQENWMADGKDMWFTPEEALKEGLIDEIIDGNVKPLEKESVSLVEMAAHYSQFTDTNQNVMNRDELIKLFGLKADATEAEIKAAVEAAAKKKDATEQPKPTNTNPTDADKLVEGIVALAKERGADEKLVNSITRIAKLDTAAAMEMIPAAKTEADPAKETKPAADLNSVLTALGKGGNSASPNADSSKWDFDEWSKHPEDFSKLLASKPEEYVKLFEAKFGYKPSLEELKGKVR